MKHVNWIKPIAVLLGTCIITACGGGGSAPTPTAEPPASANIDLAQLQGRWATTTGAVKGLTALVLPPQAGNATVWVLSQDATALSKLAITGTTTLSAAGKSYSLNTTPQTNADVTTPVSVSLTSSPKTLTLLSFGGAQANLSQLDVLTTTAALDDVATTWTASVGQESVQTTWSVATDGKITGSSTSGCAWTGTLTTTAGLGLYSYSATEDCSGTQTVVKGIASLNPDKDHLTAVGTSVDATRGLALFFKK